MVSSYIKIRHPAWTDGLYVWRSGPLYRLWYILVNYGENKWRNNTLAKETYLRSQQKKKVVCSVAWGKTGSWTPIAEHEGPLNMMRNCPFAWFLPPFSLWTNLQSPSHLSINCGFVLHARCCMSLSLQSFYQMNGLKIHLIISALVYK